MKQLNTERCWALLEERLGFPSLHVLSPSGLFPKTIEPTKSELQHCLDLPTTLFQIVIRLPSSYQTETTIFQPSWDPFAAKRRGLPAKKPAKGEKTISNSYA